MSKNLIIYFSRKGNNYTNNGIQNLEIGNTEKIVNYIQEFIEADVFEIKPKQDYPQDYMECTEVAKREQEEDARPELQNYLENIDEYDTIYIGFPNWWGTLPMPFWTQLEKLDFNGKIIKPFVTHEGSAMGNSLNDLKKLCKGAKIESDLAIQGSTVDNAKDIVEKWIKS